MSKSISRICTLTKRNIKEISREPLSIIFSLLLPLILEILFYFIFHNLTSQFDMKYLAPGIIVFSQSFLTLFAGLLIAQDRSSAFLKRLFVSNAKPFEFILSYAIALLPIVLIQSILFFIVGGIIDPSIWSVGMIYAILLSIITSLLFGGFGLLFGSICGEKSIGGVSSIIITGQSILSGMWFPSTGLSAGIITIMKCLPFKNATDLLQKQIIGINNAFDDLILPLIIVLSYTIVTYILAITFFKKNMKK